MPIIQLIRDAEGRRDEQKMKRHTDSSTNRHKRTATEEPHLNGHKKQQLE